jgi:hypothetical protein
MDLPQYFQTGHGANMIDFSFEPFGRLGLFRTKRECCCDFGRYGGRDDKAMELCGARGSWHILLP